MKFIRYGNLSAQSHNIKQDPENPYFHTAPAKFGIYAFPVGYVEPFLLTGAGGGSLYNGRYSYVKKNGKKLKLKCSELSKYFKKYKLSYYIQYSGDDRKICTLPSYHFTKDGINFFKDIIPQHVYKECLEKKQVKKESSKEDYIKVLIINNTLIKNHTNYDDDDYSVDEKFLYKSVLDIIDKKEGKLYSDAECYLIYENAPNYFNYNGNIWHHFGDVVRNSDILKRSYNSYWVLTSMDVYKKALFQIVKKYKYHEMNTHRKFKGFKSNTLDGIPIFSNKDEFEVYIEK